MKKPYRFNELSDTPCIDCGIMLKKNLLARKPEAKRCYKCSQARRKKHSKV